MRQVVNKNGEISDFLLMCTGRSVRYVDILRMSLRRMLTAFYQNWVICCHKQRNCGKMLYFTTSDKLRLINFIESKKIKS